MSGDIGAFVKHGKEYYVVVVHAQQQRVFRRLEAEDSARLAARAAGKNWRRVKREMRKAGLAWERAHRPVTLELG